MATNGTFNIPVVAGQLSLEFAWTRTNVNILTNKSTISWTVSLLSTAVASTLVSTQNTNLAVTIEGATIWNGQIMVGILPNSSKILAQGANLNISHDSDGTKTFSWSLSCEFNVTYNAINLGTITGMGTFTLDPIPRHTIATLTGNPCIFGNALTINLPRESPNFTHTISYTFGTQSGVLTTTATTNYVWTPPLTLANEIPNGTSGAGILIVTTMNGSDVIGVCRLDFTLEIGTRVPVISAMSLPQATTDIATQFGANVYVQYFSRLRLQFTTTAQLGATVKWVRIKVNGQDIDGSMGNAGQTSIATNVFTERLIYSGANNIEITVTDSRGLQTTWNGGIIVTAYTFPTITLNFAQRVTAGNVIDDNGTRMRIVYDFALTNIGGNNTPQINARTRQAGGAWAVQNNIQSGAYSGTNVQYLHPNTFSVDYGYEVELTISDWFSRNGYRTPTTSNLGYLNTPFVLTDWNNSGKGMAFGGYSTLTQNVHALSTMPWIFQNQAIYGGKQQQPIWNVRDANGANCNDMIGYGIWWVSSSSANRAEGEGWLVAIPSPETSASVICNQIWYTYGNQNIWKRWRDTGGTWGAWARVDSRDSFTTGGWLGGVNSADGDVLRFTQMDGGTTDIAVDHIYNVDWRATAGNTNANFLRFTDRAGDVVADINMAFPYGGDWVGAVGTTNDTRYSFDDRAGAEWLTIDFNRFIRGVIPIDGQNLNNLRRTGVYFLTNCTNAPSLYRHGALTTGWVEVFTENTTTTNGNQVKQIFHGYSGGADTIGGNLCHATFVRERTAGGDWHSWMPLHEPREQLLEWGQNLNTLRETGFYFTDTDALGDSCLNCPSRFHGAFSIEVKKTWSSDTLNDWDSCFQVMRHYFHPELGAFERLYDGTSWTSWKKVWTSQDDTGWLSRGLEGGFHSYNYDSDNGVFMRVKSGVLYIRLVNVEPDSQLNSGTSYELCVLPDTYWVGTLEMTLPTFSAITVAGIFNDGTSCRLRFSSRSIYILSPINTSQRFHGEIVAPMTGYL